jgi:Tol biopolymer transport system component
MDANPGRVHFSPTNPTMFAAYFFDDKNNKPGYWTHGIFDLNEPSKFKDLDLVGSGGRSDWTPDGQKIYYIGKGESFNNIWTVSPYTLEKHQITHFQDQRISNASLSPDGKTLALSRGVATGRIIKITGF